MLLTIIETLPDMESPNQHYYFHHPVLLTISYLDVFPLNIHGLKLMPAM